MSSKTRRSPYDTPPWRRAHTATSPDGTRTAEIRDAREHSMSNPTVGTLHTSDGLRLADCNPAFIWSDDSRYLVIPQWIRCFGVFLRQRLVIVDVETKTVFASRFSRLLMQPRKLFEGRLEVTVSSSLGISWERKEPLILDVPEALAKFTRLRDAYQ